MSITVKKDGDVKGVNYVDCLFSPEGQAWVISVMQTWGTDVTITVSGVTVKPSDLFHIVHAGILPVLVVQQDGHKVLVPTRQEED